MKRGKVTGFSLQITVSTFIVVLSIICHLYPVPSLAHVVKSSGTIGAILHTEPGDSPIAGQNAQIIIEFKDTDNKFDLNLCNCQLVISSNDQQLATLPIVPLSEKERLSSVNNFIFPKEAPYDLTIKGTSKQPGSFPDFELDYDINVSAKTDSVSDDNSVKLKSWFLNNLTYLIGGAIILTLITALIVNKRRERTQ